MSTKIQSRHAVWIVTAALESFQDKIKQYESDIVALERFKDAPYPNYLKKSRLDKIEELKEFLSQYYIIVEFLVEAKGRAVDMSAEEFAKAFKGTL